MPNPLTPTSLSQREGVLYVHTIDANGDRLHRGDPGLHDLAVESVSLLMTQDADDKIRVELSSKTIHVQRRRDKDGWRVVCVIIESPHVVAKGIQRAIRTLLKTKPVSTTAVDESALTAAVAALSATTDEPCGNSLSARIDQECHE